MKCNFDSYLYNIVYNNNIECVSKKGETGDPGSDGEDGPSGKQVRLSGLLFELRFIIST